MPLNRDDILRSAATPITEIEVPAFGGTVLIRAIPMGHERLAAYVNAPVLREVPETDLSKLDGLIRMGKDASKAEKTAAATANRILKASLGRQYTEPDDDEKFRRKVTGTFILGVVDVEGTRIWDWSDAQTIRDTLNWNAVCNTATAIWDLSVGASLADAKSGDPSEPGSEDDLLPVLGEASPPPV